ncbi:AI-2E family transporter [Alistipes sp. ZOR0009]|uniref:AI-2E family transporter n=1 Tax=Alistipes sp. ZOR0009 TaxID=1339253 RepID=UPI000648A74D|nr:AI-2E family transporter [Alistipes sp. ZOR0009]
MNKLARYILIAAVASIIIFLLWYFKAIVAYVLIAAVLSIIGKPLVNLLMKIKLGKFKIPKWLCAGATLALIWLVVVIFFKTFIPLLVEEANKLSNLDVSSLIEEFQPTLKSFQDGLARYLPDAKNLNLEQSLTDQVKSVVSIGSISSIFSGFTGFVGSVFIAIFSISFITFFFLKDESLFFEGVILVFPTKYEENVTRALNAVSQLLMRYFIGIVTESFLIMILVTLGLRIIGVPMSQGLVIGLIAGVLNVVPYIGPLIGTFVGIFLVITTNIDVFTMAEMVHHIIYIAIVFSIVHLIDNIVFQPLIYSNSVHAHPLEIFIVILIAGSIAGVLGMLLAIPTYTVLRVFAKEFFNNFRVVQKLTENI